MAPIQSNAAQTKRHPSLEALSPSLVAYIADAQEGPLEALKRFDSNQYPFLLITNGEGTLLGTLSEDDVRQALIAYSSFDFTLDEIKRQPVIVAHPKESIQEIISLFQNSTAQFVPIVNSSGKLLNCLTRDQFHTLVLESIPYHPWLDFFQLEKKKRQFNLAQRPWGFYKSLFVSEFTQTKIITVFPGQQLSLQKHHRREEHWTIASGQGIMTLNESCYSVSKGDNIFIGVGDIHRIRNDHPTENLVFIEVQLGDYFGEDDIVRLEDSYGRV